MTSPPETDLARACRLAAELIDICIARRKPLAGDFVKEGIDLLVQGTGYALPADVKDLTKGHFREN